jgi:hypothetical protein
MVRCFWILLNYYYQLIELLCIGRKLTYATTLSLCFSTYFQHSLKYDSAVHFLNAVMSVSIMFYSMVLAVPWLS